MTASIITIGDEILSGTTLDTNSNFISKQLNQIGISVDHIYTIHDTLEDIKVTLNEAAKHSQLIITTGGLGPTRDDKTKKALAEFFNDTIVFDTPTFEHLERYLTERKRLQILDLNRSQAEVLSKATVFQNHYGTAPCQMVHENGLMLFCLPGVPFEVKPLIKDQIIPYLVKNENKHFIVTKNITVVGIPESLLSEKLTQWEDQLPSNIALSYLPTGSRIKLKLTSSGTDQQRIEQAIDEQIALLEPLIIEHLVAKSGDKIEEILHALLLERKMTLSTAESFTSGRLAQLITSNSGSSAYYLGGVIPYSSQQKVKLLGVNPETIEKYSVVSEETATEMAIGCQKLFESDIALSTTGVAGPSKGEDGNDVGTAYYSIRINDYSETFKIFLPHFERDDFSNFVAQKVLEHLVVLLVKK